MKFLKNKTPKCLIAQALLKVKVIQTSLVHYRKKKIKSKTKLRPWHAVLLPFTTVPSL